MAPEYLDLIAKRLKTTPVDPSDVGSRSGAVLGHRLRKQEPGKISVAMVNAIARALSKRGVPTPPPMVAVIDDDDYQWIELGRSVREANKPLWTFVMAQLKNAVEKLNDRGLSKSQSALDRVLNLVDKPTKKNAKVSPRRGENG